MSTWLERRSDPLYLMATACLPVMPRLHCRGCLLLADLQIPAWTAALLPPKAKPIIESRHALPMLQSRLGLDSFPCFDILRSNPSVASMLVTTAFFSSKVRFNALSVSYWLILSLTKPSASTDIARIHSDTEARLELLRTDVASITDSAQSEVKQFS